MSVLVQSLIAASFTVCLGAIVAYLRNLSSQITQLRIDMKEVTTQVSPLWARVQNQISNDLHHPNPRYAEMDCLLEKLEGLTITVSERDRLKVLLQERGRDMSLEVSDSQRDSAKIMGAVMDKVLEEKESDNPSRPNRQYGS